MRDTHSRLVLWWAHLLFGMASRITWHFSFHETKSENQCPLFCDGPCVQQSGSKRVGEKTRDQKRAKRPSDPQLKEIPEHLRYITLTPSQFSRQSRANARPSRSILPVDLGCATVCLNLVHCCIRLVEQAPCQRRRNNLLANDKISKVFTSQPLLGVLSNKWL